MPTQNWSKKVTNTEKRVQDSDKIIPENKELILEYKRDQRINGLSDATLARNLTRLKILTETLEEPLDSLDRDGVKDLVAWLYDQEYTDGTINTYKNVIRSFYRWLDPTAEGKTPPKAAWIKMSTANGANGPLPKDLLTKEDVESQIEVANNPRDKALIAILYETGARIGELIDLTVGDVEDRTHGKKIIVEGKTGQRRLPLVQSVPHLSQWLNQHPNPDADAPLWYKVNGSGGTTLNPAEVESVADIHGIGPAIAERLRDIGIETGTDLARCDADEIAEIDGISKSRAQGWLDLFDPAATSANESLGYRYITDKILDRTMEAADIDKPSNPHHYRHSRASYLANHMKEPQLCEWFGWVQGSDVPAKYVHLSGRDIDNAYDAMHGLYEPAEEEDDDVLQCPGCGELNDTQAMYCLRCGFAIGSEAAKMEHRVESDLKQDYRETDPTDEVMDKLEVLDSLLADEEVKAALASRREA